MIKRADVQGAAIGAIAWISGYGTSLHLAKETGAAEGYAIVVGWWFTAFISAKFIIPWRSSVVLAIIYLAIFLAASISGINWLYRDIDAIPYVEMLIVAIAQALVFGSPVVFNSMINFVVKKCMGDNMVR